MAVPPMHTPREFGIIKHERELKLQDKGKEYYRQVKAERAAEEENARQCLQDKDVSVSLTHDSLDIISVIDKVRSPKAGAIVLFAGTTRDNFDGKPVIELRYTSYKSRAFISMQSIAKSVKDKHSLTAISMVHRLGVVPIGEESILIAVSAPHRQAAWKGGEEALEECKKKVEVWKLEDFGSDEGGYWRANDGAQGIKVEEDLKMEDWIKDEPDEGEEGVRMKIESDDDEDRGRIKNEPDD